MTANDAEKVKKKAALRYNEYYDLQSVFDRLYDLSKKGVNHYNLMELILSEKNILLAYRSIKNNDGSNTPGTNDTTISDIAKMDVDKFVGMVRDRMENYYPQPVRRVEIEKPGGGTRPLGIPSMEDRICQECIKQILEPIVESKFYEHSYGFRPERDTHDAIARFEHLAFSGYHFVVDIDIKSFFDSVNHGKLLKQLWTLGIRDKKLLSIISRMLKAEIKGIGIPEKGTPQGGILSPLLSNVCLNELDWWIASQWSEFPSKRTYASNDGKFQALRGTKLKEIRIVRYADDFKIMCKNYQTAQKIFIATKKWLSERLSLEISMDKSKITNLKMNYSEFLGFKLKVKKGKAKKYTNRSHMKDNAKAKVISKVKKAIKKMQKNPKAENVDKYNSTVLGMHNYYQIATMVNKDFAEISYIVNKSLKCRTKQIRSKSGHVSEAYKKFYGKSGCKKIFVAGKILFPVSAIKFKPATKYSQEICRFTAKGRAKIHTSLKFDNSIMVYLMSNPIRNESTEYNDNRISLYAGQRGKCCVTGNYLQIGNMQAHHKTPREAGGTDEYANLCWVMTDVHRLIHATVPETIEYYKNMLKLNKTSLKKLNKLRALAGNDMINDKLVIDGTPCEAKVSRTVLGEGKAGNSDTVGLPIATDEHTFRSWDTP